MNDNGYLYLIQLQNKYHIENSIFKIGRTSWNVSGRCNQYNCETKIILEKLVSQHKKAETHLLHAFKFQFGKPVIGREYFTGDINMMKIIFTEACNDFPYKKEPEDPLANLTWKKRLAHYQLRDKKINKTQFNRIIREENKKELKEKKNNKTQFKKKKEYYKKLLEEQLRQKLGYVP